VRGIALLFGVVVHASMSWLPGAQYFWVTHDTSPSALAGLVFYVPHMFRMLLFFLLAGFFARMGCERLGTTGFVRDRARRIGIAMRFADAGVRLLSSPIGPILLALPLGSAMCLHATWYAWFGIPTPDQSLYPNLAACTAFGSAFGFGWLLHRQPALLQGWAVRWPLHFCIGLLATIGCLWHIGLAPSLTPATRDIASIAYAVAYAVAGWSWTFAIVGLGLRFLSGHSRLRRYLADASYWRYIAHLPLVMALQVAMTRVPWPWLLEFALVLAMAMGLLLISYDLRVRNRFIGAWLNGRRKPRGLAPLPEAGWLAARRRKPPRPVSAARPCRLRPAAVRAQARGWRGSRRPVRPAGFRPGIARRGSRTGCALPIHRH
jgi:hypothetical protein